MEPILLGFCANAGELWEVACFRHYRIESLLIFLFCSRSAF